MVISNLKAKEIRGGLTEVLLVPELCFATGKLRQMTHFQYHFSGQRIENAIFVHVN